MKEGPDMGPFLCCEGEDRTPVRRGGYEPDGIKSKRGYLLDNLFFCCEGEDRTPDLRVLSPTSYRCSTSRCGRKGSFSKINIQTIFTPLPLQLTL